MWPCCKATGRIRKQIKPKGVHSTMLPKYANLSEVSQGEVNETAEASNDSNMTRTTTSLRISHVTGNQAKTHLC